MFRRLLLLLSFLMVLPYNLAATTWYVRADGGSRYVAAKHTGQCDGKADLAYPGRGTNQHCAFGDYRYLYDDRQTYGKMEWAIAGGDTVVIDNAKAWRVGFDQGKTANDVWCFGGPGPYGCTNPAIPSGTPAQHTRILGRNFASCAAPKSKTQMFGGFGLGVVLNLSGAQYVDVQCLEITRHSDCIVHGEPPLPSRCHSGFPIDDYDSEGIATDTATHDLLLQDVWVHGHTDRGIQGPIGGPVTANRVAIAFNGSAGWDFDDGRGTPSMNGVWTLTDSIIEWNGCNQQYPYTHPVHAASCYSQSSAGYGDGVATPAHTGLDVHIEHSVFRYNTQDGIDLGHVDTGSHRLSIHNSLAYANGGAQFKWGANFTSATVENNVVIANCMRMGSPVAGAPASFHAHLQDFCRSGDAISFNLRQNGSAVFTNNTVVTYSPNTFDVDCWDASCSNSTLKLSNNIIRGYTNAHTFAFGGQAGGPGGFYFGKPIGHFLESNNLYFGLRNVHCTFTPGERCLNPGFARAPSQLVQESDLDQTDLHATGTAASTHAGALLDSVATAGGPAYGAN